MAKAELKTKPSATGVAEYIAGLEHPVRRADAAVLCELMARCTGERAMMWGPTIIGFGSYHYRYESGHEGDMCRVGFAPRTGKLALYVGGFPKYETLLAQLGKHTRAKACLYVNKLADVDLMVLEDIARRTYAASVDGCPVC